ncbi:ROK family protein [Verrucomicrobia bacterium]|nr:ROK family protein [Verrucomicrobiota bacterium]
MRHYLGIEIGGTKLQLVVGGSGGQIAERRKLAVVPAAGARGIREQIERVLPELARGRHLTGVGVGFGGPVDWRTGRICRSHQIEGWSDFELGRWLEELSGVPVRVDNDANVGTLGEAKLGAGRGANPVFYVTLGSGVGGGLVVDGKIYHGARPGEAEIGHVRLDRRGTILESRCSGWAVDARIRRLTKPGGKTVLRRLTKNVRGGEAKVLSAAVRQGDRTAKRILNETAGDLAFGLSHVVHLFHPQVLILGGGLSGVGEPLRRAVQDSLRGFVMDAFAPGPRLAIAALREDAVPIGALVLAEDGP